MCFIRTRKSWGQMAVGKTQIFRILGDNGVGDNRLGDNGIGDNQTR